MKQYGFTLLELLVVIAVIGMLATYGVFAFIKYNQNQQMDTAVGDIENNLQTARSLAFSQVVTNPITNQPYCNPGAGLAFYGYGIHFTGSNYSIIYYCTVLVNNSTQPGSGIKSFTLPNNITVSPLTIIFRTDGTKDTPGVSMVTVTQSTSGRVKIISISTTGVITVN